jgi:hypothetical protein
MGPVPAESWEFGSGIGFKKPLARRQKVDAPFVAGCGWSAQNGYLSIYISAMPPHSVVNINQ